MFSGIVEKSTSVIGVADSAVCRRLTLATIWPDPNIGESISVNGCCLTVAEIGPSQLGFDVVAETLSKTNLGLLRVGDRVHVERAMVVGDRIDGHFVQGHIDGTAPQIKRIENGPNVRLTLKIPEFLAKYMVPKGSITVDGVSLTIAAVAGAIVELAIIPTTVRLTSIASHQDGWPFNIEADILSKTIVTWLEQRDLKGMLAQSSAGIL